jgi:hypothetical protein
MVSVTGASASPGSFTGSDGGTTATVEANVPYAVTVTPTLPNYVVALSAGCTGTLVLDGVANCTVSLSDIAVVTDTTSPVTASHGNIEMNATSSVGVIVEYVLPLVTDDHDANVVAACVPVSGALFPIGLSTVSCGAKDQSGNDAQLTTFTVLVTNTETASTTPIIVVPPPVTPPPPPPAPAVPPASDTPAPSAGGGSGSVTFDHFGCMNPLATNFDRLANKDDGACVGVPEPVVTIIATSSSSSSSSTSSTSTATSSVESVTETTTVSESTGEVLGTSTYNFTRKLRMRSQGNDVIELQKRLTELGFYFGPITGYFGKLTSAAVSVFQAAQGLDTVGTVGPLTLAALNQNFISSTLATITAAAHPLSTHQ